MMRLTGMVTTLVLGCAGVKSNPEGLDMAKWKETAAKQMAKAWSTDLSQVSVIVHEKPAVDGVTVFAVVQPSPRGGYKRYAPGVVAEGALVLDADKARGAALQAAGLGRDGADATTLATLAALMVPNQPGPGKLIVDPERGAYFEQHFGIVGVAPPVTREVDGRPALDFWVSTGSGDPVEHYVVPLLADGTAPIRR